MQLQPRPDYLSVELEGRPTHVYNESAFHYFLSVERRRSDRASRPFALLLIERKLPGQLAARIDAEMASRLFSGLSLCLRETDFIGWYKDSTVPAAVLTHLDDRSDAELSQQVRRRIEQVAFAALLPEVSNQFAIRLYQLPAQENELGENWN
jgi:hypothetical protein